MLFGLLTFTILVVTAAACQPADIRMDATPSLVIHYFDRPGSKTLYVDAGAYVDLEYTWKVGTNFRAPQKNLTVFVHFRNSDGEIIALDEGRTFQDDHVSDPPISSWKAGEDVVYTRKMFKIPESLGARNYQVSVFMGVYDLETKQRVELADADSAEEDNSVLVTTFHIRKNPKIYPGFDITWNGPEPQPNKNRRWSKKQSVVIFSRDRQALAADLYFSGHSPAEDIGGEQRMWIYMHEKGPEFLVTEEPLVFTHERVELTRIAIPQELYQTNSNKDIRLIFEVNKLLPAGPGDNRTELGFEFHEILLLPKNIEK